MTGPNIIAILAALLVSISAPLGVRPLLTNMKVIDYPNERSSHSAPVLRGAGLAPLLGFITGMALLASIGDPQLPQLLVIGVTAAAVGALGLIEDLRGVRIIVRASTQLMMGAGATWALVLMFQADLWWVPVGALFFAGYTNAANFMDGINGVSSLHGASIGTTFAIIGVFTDQPWLIGTGLVLAVAFLAFLPWNLGGRGMFLGDVGSYLLGGAISTVVIAAVLNGTSFIAMLAPLGIYLADTTVTLLRRIVRGEEWQHAHRSHVYQKMTDAGMPHLAVALVVTVATLATGALGLLSLDGSIALSVGALVGIAAVSMLYLSLPKILAAGASAVLEGGGVVTAPAVQMLAAEPSSLRWAVVGGTGFIGSALVEGLRQHGVHVVSVTAPRLELPPSATPAQLRAKVHESSESIATMETAFSGIDVVVNAAGLAVPDSESSDGLFGANALLPAIVLSSAEGASVHRFIHLSSAAVQGRRQILDESAETSPFSPYSRSKALGESALLSYSGGLERVGKTESVILRATSVQGPGRSTTRQLQRLAQSPLASVASPGDAPTVVSSLRGLVEFIMSVGNFASVVPPIVLQPSEGMTTSSVLRLAGGRSPIRIPAPLCRGLSVLSYIIASRVTSVQGPARRLELMWFGQKQDAAWARENGLERESYVGDALLRESETTR